MVVVYHRNQELCRDSKDIASHSTITGIEQWEQDIVVSCKADNTGSIHKFTDFYSFTREAKKNEVPSRMLSSHDPVAL